MDTDMKMTDGAIAKMSRLLTAEEQRWVTLPHLHAQTRLTIEQFFEAGDPEQNEIPVDFYEAIDEHGCTVVVPADAVEQVYSAAEAAARAMPDPEQIAEAVQSAVTSLFVHSDRFDVEETVRSGREVEAYGRTDEGLTFGFRVTVSAPWRTDS